MSGVQVLELLCATSQSAHRQGPGVELEYGKPVSLLPPLACTAGKRGGWQPEGRCCDVGRVFIQNKPTIIKKGENNRLVGGETLHRQSPSLSKQGEQKQAWEVVSPEMPPITQAEGGWIHAGRNVWAGGSTRDLLLGLKWHEVEVA